MSLALDGIGSIVQGETHLADITLRLEPATLNVLLGPTLAGKTSLMRIMAGLDRPTAGRIFADGVDVTGVHVRQRSVAMVYQQFINYAAMSVYENIASPLRVQRRSAAEIDSKVRAAAELLRLTPYLDRQPAQLSGGQQQRCALARALVKEARLVLLDEPLVNLDYKLREELREELPKLFAKSGAILVYATTEPTEALLLGGRTIGMGAGRVLQYGPTPEVYRRPASLAAAQVFSDPPLNVIRVEKREGSLRFPDGRSLGRGAFPSLPDGGYALGVRAHHLALGGGDADAIRLRGEVEVTEITGSESFVHVRDRDLRLVALADGVRDLQPGAEVEVAIRPADVFVFDQAGRPVHGGPV
jgi:glycerol transport system ATP-binding protein